MRQPEMSSDNMEDWVLPAEKLSMRIRRFPSLSARLRPACFVLLILGQCSTTLWAAYLAGFWLLCSAALAAALAAKTLLQYQPPAMQMQVFLVLTSVAFSFGQVINLYSAMSLYPLISMPDSSCSCLNWLYLPAFALLAGLYAYYCLWTFPLRHIVHTITDLYGDSTTAAAVRAPAGCSWFTLFGHALCVLATALCILWALLLGLSRFLSTCGLGCSCALGSSHSVGLLLHSVVLVSAELFRHTLVAWNHDVVRVCLYGGQWLVEKVVVNSADATARAAAPPGPRTEDALVPRRAEQELPKGTDVSRKISQWFKDELDRFESGDRPGRFESMKLQRRRAFQLWNLLHELIPPLRQAAPPKTVVAVLVALQHTAPVLTVAGALLVQLSWSWVHLRLVLLGLAALLWWETAWQRKSVPDAALQRILLLVPTDYLDPFSRSLLGYGLSVTKHVQRATGALDTGVRRATGVLDSVFRLAWPS